MTTETKTLRCHCRGEQHVLDVFQHSQTVQCLDCQLCTLILGHPNFDHWIPLGDFDFKRGNRPGQRSLDDLTMAQHLVDCLFRDIWPSDATILDFGIESSRHLGALQYAVYAGATAYDLDRVLGIGWTITQLVRAARNQPYGEIEFRTVYDEWMWDDDESGES